MENVSNALKNVYFAAGGWSVLYMLVNLIDSVCKVYVITNLLPTCAINYCESITEIFY